MVEYFVSGVWGVAGVNCREKEVKETPENGIKSAIAFGKQNFRIKEMIIYIVMLKIIAVLPSLCMTRSQRLVVRELRYVSASVSQRGAQWDMPFGMYQSDSQKTKTICLFGLKLYIQLTEVRGLLITKSKLKAIVGGLYVRIKSNLQI